MAVEETDFAAAYADIACGYIGVGTDMTRKFGHETLAETHHFIIRFSLGIEVGSSFSATHGKRGEAVLEGLFEGKEFQNAQINCRVETQTSLVGANGAVHLNAVAAVDFDFAFVVSPGNTKHDDTFGLGNSLQNFSVLVLGILLNKRNQALGHFLYGLMEFWFCGIFGNYLCHELRYSGIHK